MSQPSAPDIQSLIYAGSLITTDLMAIRDCLRGPDGRYAGDQALRETLHMLLSNTENMLQEVQSAVNLLDARQRRQG